MRKLLIITAAITLSLNCAFAQDLVLSDVLEQARTLELGQTQTTKETTKTQDEILTPVKNEETIKTNTDTNTLQEVNTKPAVKETTVPTVKETTVPTAKETTVPTQETTNTMKMQKGQKLPTTKERPLTQTNQVTTPDNTVDKVN